MLNRETLRKNPSIIEKEISKFKHSELYEKMLESDKYYHMENPQIMNRRHMMWLNGTRKVHDEDLGGFRVTEYATYTEDKTKANNKLPHGFHYELVNQCKNFLAGKPVQLTWKHDIPEDEFKLEVDRILNEHNDWGTFNQIMIKNAQKYSRAFARIVIHPVTQELRFVPLSPLELITYYDDFDDMYLAIRFFTVEEYDENGEEIVNEYVEVFDIHGKDTYKRGDKGYELISEEAYIQERTVYGEEAVEVEDKDWGRIPIIEWRFTDDGINALEPIKHFIDLADANLSDYANDLDDINELIWIVKNYDGQDIGDMLESMKRNKILKVNGDGDVRAERNELPYQARKELYEIIVRNIYRFGRGIDFTDRSNLGNITGTGLKWSYELLEEKANEIEQHGQKALDNLFYFIFKWMDMQGYKNDFDATNIEFVFDRSLMINEAEAMDNMLKYSQVGSVETALENSPWVHDVDEELKRIDENSDSGEELAYGENRRVERDSDAEEIYEDGAEVPEWNDAWNK